MAARKQETVTFGGRTYRKFIAYPARVTDGSVRCIFCGQIDEPEAHEGHLCPAVAPLATQGAL